jgi:RNA polymerase subunit RPABC4/transcription elongation factor Spt4
MATRFCTHCGLEIPEGRKFCRGCGKPAAFPSQKLPAPSRLVAEPTLTRCSQCGNPVPDGKRFCPHCGKAVASAPPPQAVSVPTPPPTETVAAVAVPSVSSPTAPPSPRPGDDSVIPAIVSEPNLASHATASSKPVASLLTGVASRENPPAARRRALQVGVLAVAVLLAAGATTVWHFRGRLSLKRAVASASTGSSAPVSPPTQQAQKPMASVPASQRDPVPSPTAVAEPESTADTVRDKAERIKAPPAGPATEGDHPTPDSSAVIESALPPSPTPPPVAPSAMRSGTLHYTGPPVPHGGIVVFSDLPAGRLRFTFDHLAWQPLISHRPDGTQTLMLRSLVSTEQTRCDVQWEVIE